MKMDRTVPGSSTKSSLPKAYDVEAREREEKRKRGHEDEGREELDSFPVMMSFKAFLETQDDNITDDEALVKYGEYKLEFKRQKLNEFFVSHKQQEWFRTKYQPQGLSAREKATHESAQRRCEIFNELSAKGFMDAIRCTQDEEVDIVKLLDSVVILLEGGNYEDMKNLDLELNNNDLIKHKSSSLFIKNLHPSITRADLLDLVQKYPGFQRLAISEADPKINFSRRCWVSFARNAKIREICFAMNNVQLKGLELQAVVNKDLSKRTRTVEDILNAEKVLEKDIKIALDIVKFQDAKRGLWMAPATKNPDKVVPDNNENIPPTDSAATETADKSAEVPENPLLAEGSREMSSGEELRTMMDKLVLYLRIVHSIDFYSQKDYKGEDDMPNRCGLIHVRSGAVSEFDEVEVEKVLVSREAKFKQFVTNSPKVGESEARKLGLKDQKFEIEKFISANSQELAKDKWLCTLSGKKFKALEFIKKHIVNKFADKIEEVKAEVEFFNNYILDPARPQLPEEKPQPPVNKAKKLRLEDTAPVPERVGIKARLGVREEVSPPRSRVKVTHANSDPRSLIDYSDIDSSVFDLFG